ncbi:MAG: dephospho-CoA kinase [Deltaproteobacteria bacterium]|nr:dephospho-CoA kinase [Deltaproteobacteria bacterium]
MTFRRIGLTGNIGSGKSEVALLLQQAGLAVVDLDDIGRAVSELPATQNAIASLFGPSSRNSDGSLNRRFVQQTIFSDPTKKEALEKLLHPLIWTAFEAMEEALKKKGAMLVVCEAALIYEAQIDKRLDFVIVVTANEKLRRDRVTLRDGLSPEAFDHISKAQMSEDEKLKRASAIIDNSDGIESLRPQVSSLINRWRSLGYLEPATELNPL